MSCGLYPPEKRKSPSFMAPIYSRFPSHVSLMKLCQITNSLSSRNSNCCHVLGGEKQDSEIIISLNGNESFAVKYIKICDIIILNSKKIKLRFSDALPPLMLKCKH